MNTRQAIRHRAAWPTPLLQETLSRDEEFGMDPVTANGRDDLFLLDVREPAEWQSGHVNGATHIPMGDLGAAQGSLPTDRPILCICRSGQRSAMVTSALERAGYDAQNLEGGLLAWVEARLPLVTDEGAPGTVI